MEYDFIHTPQLKQFFKTRKSSTRHITSTHCAALSPRWGGEWYLPWLGDTYHGQGVPTLAGRYIPGWGAPTLDKGTYPGLGVPNPLAMVGTSPTPSAGR